MTEKIPSNKDEMIRYLKSLKIFDKKILDITLKMAEEQNLQVYGAFGIRNEYSTEMDIITPPPSEEELAVGEMINLAIQLKNQGRYDEAFGIYDSILTKEPDNEFALINKAILLKNTEKIAEAIKIYDKILKNNPHNFSALANKGAALACVSKYKEAIEYYDKALGIQPDEPMLLNNKKDASDALKSKKKQSKNEELIERGLTAFRLGEDDEALKYYDEALKIDPKNKDAIQLKEVALTNKAIDLIDKEEYIKALVVLENCHELNPHSVSIYVNTGLCYEKLEKYDKALENYDKAIKIDSKDPTALNNKGYVLFLAGRYSEAIEYFDKSLKINPYNIRVLTNKQMALQMISK